MKTLLDHFDTFMPDERGELAEVYMATSPEPRALVDAICQRPDRLLALAKTLEFEERLELAYFVQAHDRPVFCGSDLKLETFRRWGLVARLDDEHAIMPGGIAAALATLQPDDNITLITLMGSLSNAEVTSLGARYGIAENTRIETTLALSEYFCQDEVMEAITSRLPEMDYLGAALVAIELAGTCYWQEVFGYEPESNGGGGDVVPFMLRDERQEEEDIAQNLLELGVIFRLEDDPYPRLVVPEELWRPIWELGRMWLCDWLADTFARLSESGVGKQHRPSNFSLQHALKVMSLMADPVGASWARLKNRAKRIDFDVDWDLVSSFAVETSVVSIEGRTARATVVADGLLDSPRPSFVRQMLFEWCAGYVGAKADEGLGTALGLDMTWRDLAIEQLEVNSDFVPLWMRGEAVPSETTGGGVLRDGWSQRDDLGLEFALLNELVTSMKLLLLDLLSLLPDEYWFSVDLVLETVQMVASWATFDRLATILEHPYSHCYMPVQRSSVVTDPYHADCFRIWLVGLLENLLVPLGVASFQDGLVRFDTSVLRIASPMTGLDEVRRGWLAEIFDSPDFEFKIPASHNGFRPVPTVSDDPDRVWLALPLAELRELMEGKVIKGMDHESLVLGKAPASRK